MGKRKTTDEFIEMAKSIHGNRFDYSLVEYKNNHTKVKIICHEHGIFEQKPIHHLRGHGCHECGIISSHAKRCKTTEEFIIDAYCKHGDKYNYKLVEYKNTETKVKIICHEHGVFEQTPHGHLSSNGCYKCGYDQNELKDAICPKCGKKHKIRKRAAPKLTPCIECGGNDPTVKREKEEYCLYCGKKLINKRYKYCNHNCQRIYQYLIYINKWKLGLVDGIKGKASISGYIRYYLFEKYNNSCQKCEWGIKNEHTGKVPLEVHHIDGDYTNNKENNLELLCPNCHSLTDNYKSRNKNNKRTHR